MRKSKIKDDNYFQVSGWMLNRLNLKGTALEVFAIIYGFSQDGESKFTGSLQYLCDFTRASKPTIIKALKYLVANDYIKKWEIERNGVVFNEYAANLMVVKNFYSDGKETLMGGSKETLPGGSKETLPNNKDTNNKLDNDIRYIIAHLNKKAGTKYRATSKETQRLLKGKLTGKDAYTVEDCITVIDKRTAVWLGTTMEEYLRPETLFGSKFESYLNAKTNNKKGGNSYADNRERAERESSNKWGNIGTVL